MCLCKTFELAKCNLIFLLQLFMLYLLYQYQAWDGRGRGEAHHSPPGSGGLPRSGVVFPGYGHKSVIKYKSEKGNPSITTRI